MCWNPNGEPVIGVKATVLKQKGLISVESKIAALIQKNQFVISDKHPKLALEMCNLE